MRILINLNRLFNSFSALPEKISSELFKSRTWRNFLTYFQRQLLTLHLLDEFLFAKSLRIFRLAFEGVPFADCGKWEMNVRNCRIFPLAARAYSRIILGKMWKPKRVSLFALKQFFSAINKHLFVVELWRVASFHLMTINSLSGDLHFNVKRRLSLSWFFSFWNIKILFEVWNFSLTEFSFEIFLNFQQRPVNSRASFNDSTRTKLRLILVDFRFL